MRIKIPIQNNVEVVLADVFIDVNVGIRPLYPPKTTDARIAIKQVKVTFNYEVYCAVKKAMEKIGEEHEN